MIGIAELIQEARSAGATFDISGADIVVHRGKTIPPDVRAALKGRRDEMFHHLTDTRPSSQGLLSGAGVDVVLVEDGVGAEALVDEMLADAAGRPLGLDIETAARPDAKAAHGVRLTKRGVSVSAPKNDAALDPRKADVRLLQIYGGGKRCAVLDMRKVPWPTLAPIWGCPLAIHNVMFEMKFLAAQGVRLRRAECTMQAAGLMLGVHRRGIAATAAEYLGWEMPKDLQTSNWGAPQLSEEQLAYAALDAVAARLLWDKLKRDMQRKGRWDAYVLQRDVIPAAVEMETAGVGVDSAALDENIEKWSRELAAARRDWQGETGAPPPGTPNEIRLWLTDNLTAEELADWPRTAESEQLSTSASSLERAAHLSATRPLLEMKRLEKLLGSFGPSLRNSIHPATGRIHASYLVAGTKSGRWSCRAPNLQQMPGERLAPGFRAVFKAPPGRVLIGADYSQMEMRAVAEISGDVALRQVYTDGQDIHALTAAAMAGILLEEVTKEQRDRAKPVNFGSIYGMGPARLAAAAWNNYRIEMGLSEARQALDAFFRKFPTLRRWMRDNADKCAQNRRIDIGAGRVVENAWEPDGIRYTQCCNLPVQGACADAMMRAVIGIHRRIHEAGLDASPVAQVHDEIILEASRGDGGAVARILKIEMVAAFVETFPDAPIKGLVEVHLGRTWADLK